MNLSSITDQKGFIKIAAFDHRDSLKKFIPADKLIAFKELLAKEFASTITAILVDPEYGKPAIAAAKEKNIGVMLSREHSGYTEGDQNRELKLYEQFDAEKLKEMGANAIKILVYYNDNASGHFQKMDTLKKAREEAHNAGLPFLIEPIVYPLNETDPFDKAHDIVESTIALQEYADILKIEFPLNDTSNVDSSRRYLEKIKSQVQIPWIVLSRGMEYDSFQQALELSREYGSKGYAVGRSVWQEVSNYKEWNDIENYIKTIGVERMRELSTIFE